MYINFFLRRNAIEKDISSKNKKDTFINYANNLYKKLKVISGGKLSDKISEYMEPLPIQYTKLNR